MWNCERYACVCVCVCLCVCVCVCVCVRERERERYLVVQIIYGDRETDVESCCMDTL